MVILGINSISVESVDVQTDHINTGVNAININFS